VTCSAPRRKGPASASPGFAGHTTLRKILGEFKSQKQSARGLDSNESEDDSDGASEVAHKASEDFEDRKARKSFGNGVSWRERLLHMGRHSASTAACSSIGPSSSDVPDIPDSFFRIFDQGDEPEEEQEEDEADDAKSVTSTDDRTLAKQRSAFGPRYAYQGRHKKIVSPEELKALTTLPAGLFGNAPVGHGERNKSIETQAGRRRKLFDVQPDEEAMVDAPSTSTQSSLPGMADFGDIDGGVDSAVGGRHMGRGTLPRRPHNAWGEELL